MSDMYALQNIQNLNLDIKKPSIVFLYGDLWSGKTTLSQSIIRKYSTQKDTQATSPTYVYYNKYDDIYHFDLYRLESYEDFVSIGGEEILDNNEGIILIEWPQILEPYFIPDVKIYLSKTQRDNERKIEIEYLNTNG